MGRVKKTPVLALLCMVLSILTIVAMMPGMAYASETTDGSATQSGNMDTTGTMESRTWDHSKSKTATNLTKDSKGNLTSEVTLSLPSKEEKLDSDIVFVMDKSSCNDETANKMNELLRNLNQALTNSGASVKIGMIAFDGTGHDLYSMKKFDGSEDQINQISSAAGKNSIPLNQKVGGTNMQAGLVAAKDMLDKDTSVQKSRKYMIMVTDGMTRLFTGSDGEVKDIYYKGQYSYNYIYGMIDEWDQYRFGPITNGDNYNPYRNKNNLNWSWGGYWSQVQKWVQNDGDTYAQNYKKYGNAPTNIDNNFNYLTDDSAGNHAMAVDRAVYEAYNAYKDMVDSGYQCYAIQVGSYKFAEAFLGALNSLSGNKCKLDFNDIVKNRILYLVGAGSTVTDTIGDQFDLTDPKKMELTIDDEQENSKTYDAVKIDENHYGFLPQEGDKKYAYEVAYTPDNKDTKIRENIVWTTNVPITNFQHVSLTYQEKLKEPKTEPGTYGQLDLNGDGRIDGTSTLIDTSKAIYTNESAILQPKDSDGKGGTSENFGKPSVSYTVEKTTPTTPTEPTEPTTPSTPTEPTKPEEHTITFQPNNGQPTFTQTVPDGGQAVLPDEPSKKGHKFIGWYTDSALTKAYDFSTPVKSDLTLYAKWKKGIPTSHQVKKITGILLPKVIAKGKHTQVLTWTALKNVDGYFIYTNRCDEAHGRIPHPFKKVADYKASKARVYTKKHLTTYRNYKYYVAAYKIKHGKKVIVRNSVTVHSVCGNTSARSTNVKAVKAAKHAITLKKGQSYKLKASIYKVNKKKAFLDQTHCALLRYLTANSKVATVDYNTGKIKAVKAGKTNIYVLGVNGIRDKVTVTVK